MRVDDHDLLPTYLDYDLEEGFPPPNPPKPPDVTKLWWPSENAKEPKAPAPHPHK
jgi:hypothetical protein